MLSKYQDLVKAIYPLFDGGEAYVEIALEEAELLGIEATDREVFFVGGLIREAENLQGALSALESLEKESIDAIAQKEMTRVQAASSAERKLLAKEKALESRMKSDLADQQKIAELIGKELKKALSAANLGGSPPQFDDYRIVTAMGDDDKKLWPKVNHFLREGWVPLGGIDITLSPNGVMLFSQAVGKPKKK